MFSISALTPLQWAIFVALCVGVVTALVLIWRNPRSVVARRLKVRLILLLVAAVSVALINRFGWLSGA